MQKAKEYFHNEDSIVIFLPARNFIVQKILSSTKALECPFSFIGSEEFARVIMRIFL